MAEMPVSAPKERSLFISTTFGSVSFNIALGFSVLTAIEPGFRICARIYCICEAGRLAWLAVYFKGDLIWPKGLSQTKTGPNRTPCKIVVPTHCSTQ